MLAARGFYRTQPEPTRLLAANVLTLLALLMGGLTLLLTVAALRVRSTPPPKSVTAATLLIGGLPFLVLWALSFFPS